MRLRNEVTAVIVNVSDDTAERLKAEGWVPADPEPDPPEDTTPDEESTGKRARGRPRGRGRQ